MSSTTRVASSRAREDDRWSIHHGDCLPWLRAMPDASVGCVITDPPYETEAHTLQRRASRGAVAVVEPLDFAPMTEETRASVGAEIARVCRRWALVFCQIEAAQLWRRALSGMSYRRTCIWVKPDGQLQLSGDRPGMGYEAIVACHRKGASTWNGGGRSSVFTHNKNELIASGKHAHPTQKPTSLMADLVSLFTEEDEEVCDPFAGSGSTGVACVRLGRRFRGAEVDARHVATAIERLRAEVSGTTLDASRAGQVPLFGGGAST